MTGELTLTCVDFRPLHRNALYGLATIRISELKLELKDVAVHQKNAKRWAQLPSKPVIKDGTVVKGDDGKITYLPIMSFTNRAVADAFSAAVIEAVLESFPEAFDAEPVQ